MKYIRAINPARGTTLGDRVGVADRWWLRLRGLQGTSALGSGEGLLLTPCRAVHMLGMRFPIDVAFLDDRGRVIASYLSLGRGRRTRYHRGAQSALELPAGVLAASGTLDGDLIECQEVAR